MSTTHEAYMQQALELAQQGAGVVNPNPMVGAIIVKNNTIIGQGYHTQYGAPHAEVEALASANSSVAGATIYVTLEPCSHYGKTPPCTSAIIQSGIKKVVIAMTDPNPVVNGQGIQLLQKADIEVLTGVLEHKAKALNKIFIKQITKKQPYVLMKTATTLDGKIATNTGDSQWITGQPARDKVHSLRHQLMGIMVGVNTVLQDNPYLNCRLDNQTVCHPIKIIVDSTLRTPLTANVFQGQQLIMATTSKAKQDRIKQYQQNGADVIVTGNNQVDLNQLMTKLHHKGIDSILLEGGAKLNASALKAGIVDEIWTFIAPKIIGGQAPSFVDDLGVAKLQQAYQLQHQQVKMIGNDILIKSYLNNN